MSQHEHAANGHLHHNSHHGHHKHAVFEDIGMTKANIVQNSNGTFFEIWANLTEHAVQASENSPASTNSSHLNHQHMHHTKMDHGSVEHHSMDHSSSSYEPIDHSGSHHGDHDMATFFYFGFNNVQMVFKNWVIDDIGGLITACIIIMVVSVFYEWLKVWRDNLTTTLICRVQNRLSVSRSTPTTDRVERLLDKEARASDSSREYLLQPVAASLKDGLKSTVHITLAITYTLQQLISLFLMLVFMTFNLYLCLTIVMSHGLGYYLFGWKRMILSSGGSIISESANCH